MGLMAGMDGHGKSPLRQYSIAGPPVQRLAVPAELSPPPSWLRGNRICHVETLSKLNGPGTGHRVAMVNTSDRNMTFKRFRITSKQQESCSSVEAEVTWRTTF
jgi:hypothetical protein